MATWEFVGRRIDDLVWLSKAKSNLSTLFSTVASGAFSIVDGLINSQGRRQTYNNSSQQCNQQGHHQGHSHQQSNTDVDQQNASH